MASVRVSFVPATPVGERSSHAIFGSSPTRKNFWDWSIESLRTEMSRIHANNLDPKLTAAEHLDYWHQLKALIAKAEQGRVVISEGPGADAKVLHGMILELRPFLVSDRPAFGRIPRILRLYYGEPATVEHCLLGLHLDTKEANQSGLAEQNGAIEEAKTRAHDWACANA